MKNIHKLSPSNAYKLKLLYNMDDIPNNEYYMIICRAIINEPIK